MEVPTHTNALESLSAVDFAHLLIEQIDKELNKTTPVLDSTKEDLISDDPKRFADINDRASDQEIWSKATILAQGEQARISKLRAAKERLLQCVQRNSCSFLECEECGTQIDRRRLCAQPTTRKCTVCKNLEERHGHKTYGHAPGQHLWARRR